jgi:hypothetical protein
MSFINQQAVWIHKQKVNKQHEIVNFQEMVGEPKGDMVNCTTHLKYEAQMYNVSFAAY